MIAGLLVLFLILLQNPAFGLILFLGLGLFAFVGSPIPNQS